jgi:hypothetical protein
MFEHVGGSSSGGDNLNLFCNITVIAQPYSIVEERSTVWKRKWKITFLAGGGRFLGVLGVKPPPS